MSDKQSSRSLTASEKLGYLFVEKKIKSNISKFNTFFVYILPFFNYMVNFVGWFAILQFAY